MVANGSPDRVHQTLQAVSEAEPSNEHAGQDARCSCIGQLGDDRVDGGLEFRRVAGRLVECDSRIQHLLVGQIRREGHVHGPVVVERSFDQPLRFGGDVVRGHDRAGAHHGVGHLAEKVELPVAQCVVHQRPGRLHLGGGHPGEMEHRQVLGVGARDRVERAQFADAIGGAQRRQPTDPGIPVRGVARVELVAAPDPRDVGVVDDRVLDWEGEVARDTEDGVDADVVEAVEHVFDHCLRHRSAAFPSS